MSAAPNKGLKLPARVILVGALSGLLGCAGNSPTHVSQGGGNAYTPTDTQVCMMNLANALSRPSPGSRLLVAEQPPHGVIGVVFLQTRQDYFTERPHGYVAILAVAGEAEGRGVGRALLKAAEEWGRANGLTKLTLAVFTDNRRAKAFYERQGWRPELETWYKELGVDEGAA